MGSRARDRSPGSRPSQAARATRRMILPLRVRGRSGTTTTASGERSCRGRDDELGDLGARARASVAPGRRTRSTTIASPLSSSGTPIAAASTTAGWATAAASTSAGPTRLPATLSVSSERPWMYQKPSSSIVAQSPWIQSPGIATPVASRGSASVGRRPEAAGHARPRRADRELADLAPHGRARRVDDVGGHPEARPVERRRLGSGGARCSRRSRRRSRSRPSS